MVLRGKPISIDSLEGTSSVVTIRCAFLRRHSQKRIHRNRRPEVVSSPFPVKAVFRLPAEGIIVDAYEVHL